MDCGLRQIRSSCSHCKLSYGMTDVWFREFEANPKQSLYFDCKKRGGGVEADYTPF